MMPPPDPALGDKVNEEQTKDSSKSAEEKQTKDGSKVAEEKPTKDGSKPASKPSKTANSGGVKLKMPSSQLTRFTKAYNSLARLVDAQGVGDPVEQALTSVENELIALVKECSMVQTQNEALRRQKQEWMDKNVPACPNEWLQQLQEAARNPGGLAAIPEIRVNGAFLEVEDIEGDRRSSLSVLSGTSSVRRAAAEAQAEREALALEQQYLERRHQQELEERQERQRFENEQVRKRLMREREEVQLHVDQARVREQALNRALSERGSIREGGSHRAALDLPRLTQPVHNWLSSASMCAGSRTGPPLPPLPRQEPAPRPATPAPLGFDQALVQHLLLAQAKLPTFSGDPLEFLWFKQAFEDQVERVTPDPRRRLHLLLQQLKGEPYTLVKGCQLLTDAATGYARAKAKLADQYGNSVRQAYAFKTRLLTWPNLKKDSAKDLRAFSIQLQHCEDVKAVGRLDDLDAPGTIVQLMSKLPERQQQSWRLKAYDIETARGYQANYSDFVAFVKRIADAQNHPAFGVIVSPDDRQPSRQLANVRATSSESQAVNDQQEAVDVLSTSTESAPPEAFKAPCIFCEQSHPAAKCTSNRLTRAEKLERLRGLCFGCLKPGHQARQCKHRLKCSICQGLHPTVLHDPSSRTERTRATATTTASADADEPSGDASDVTQTNEPHCNARATAVQERIVVATVPVRVRSSNGNHAVIRAIIDNASSATFVTKALASQLSSNSSDTTSLRVSTLTGTSSVDTTVLQDLKVSNLDDGTEIALPPVYTVEKLPFSNSELLRRADVEAWEHLQHVPINWTQAEVSMLIGINAPDATMPNEIMPGAKGAPYAFRTKLGWSVNGPITKDSGSTVLQAAQVRRTSAQISGQLEAMYYRDFKDAFEFNSKGPSQEDQEWLARASASIQLVEETRPNEPPKQRYQLRLPFHSPEAIPLQNNKSQALRQLQTLTRKFSANDTFYKDYCAFMKKMEDGGFVEPVPHNEEWSPGLINYVPHHGVYHPRKPGKIRVVFNCASKYRGVSLNDCLIPGPDITSSLIGVLLRFRTGFVPFIADIESMFYQVLVPPDQRDALRYLWWPQGDLTQPPQSYRLKVHLFGAASSPSCANFALRHAANETPGLSAKATEAVRRNFYVNDCLASADTTTDAISLATDIVQACNYGGFCLTKFVSPSLTFLKALPPTELAKDLQAFDLSDDKNDPLGGLSERALGMAWCVASDCFVFRTSEQGGPHEANTRATKRHILSRLSAVYDPLGIAAPVIIQARVLFRQLTKQPDLGWDDAIGQQEQEQWLKWIKQLPDLTQLKLRRCLRSTNGGESLQLHTFCDASTDAYAAVVYLRQASSEDSSATNLSFVLGKARVTPPKTVTIPRLELTAAKLATDLAGLACKELQVPLSNRFFWTDSQTVIKYLNNRTKRFHTFVSNRIASILAVSAVEEWKFVPTKLNPSDSASRGLQAAQLADSFWLKGPTFLWKGKGEWPSEDIDKDNWDDLEVRVRAQATEDEECFVEYLAKRYSTAQRYRRALAIWLRFKAWLQGKPIKGPITVDEMQSAERAAIAWLQLTVWKEEIQLLRNQKTLPRASPLFKLSPIWKGLVYMQSRARTSLPIVPQSRLAQLLVEEAHVRQAHLGRQSTQAEAARHHWIIGLSKYARQAVKGCTSCQLRHAKPMTTVMADLPEFRVTSSIKPFEETGVDYFGPFFAARGRATVKMYGVIFTCATSRAVHLEVSENLSAQSFINALRRFVCRRGQVKRFISDNGTNFKGAEAQLRKELAAELSKLQANDSALRTDLSKKGIQWSFNPPGASHYGGFWERLIRSIRRVLEALLDSEAQRPLSMEALTTLMCEVEATLNNRPLTPVSDDADDFEALTPNHLLSGHCGPLPPPGDFQDGPSLANRLRHRWKHVQHLAAQFWQRWHCEYKALLHLKSKWHTPKDRQLRLDDIVLLVDSSSPREQWRLGRVITVFRSSNDGRIRSAEVRTSRGNVVRPIMKLCLLETASFSS